MAIEGNGPFCPFAKGLDGKYVPCDKDCTVPGLVRLFKQFANDGVDINFEAAERIERRRCVRLRK